MLWNKSKSQNPETLNDFARLGNSSGSFGSHLPIRPDDVFGVGDLGLGLLLLGLASSTANTHILAELASWNLCLELTNSKKKKAQVSK